MISSIERSEKKKDLRTAGIEDLIIRDHRGEHRIDPASILRLQADNNYTWIHLEGGRSVLVSKTLKALERNVSTSGFVRIHKSHLVKLDLITSIGRTTIKVSGCESLPIARRRRRQIIEKIEAMNFRSQSRILNNSNHTL